MAHLQQRRYFDLVGELFLPRDRSNLSVLEVGSYDVNGSLRDCFPGASYLGVDLCAGPGVDIVASGHELTFADHSFDVTLSAECFEHNEHWQPTFLNMHRMTKPDGIVIVTCAGRGRLEHGTSRTSPDNSPGTHSIGNDYYLNLEPRDFERLNLERLFKCWHICAVGLDTYFIGWMGAYPDLTEFARRVPAIRVYERLAVRLYRLPFGLAARLLPDRQFQNFVLGYKKLTRPVRKVGEWLVKPASH